MSSAESRTPAPANATLKRSHAPIFWLLFGAGGMLAALAGVALAWIAGIALPMGLVGDSNALDYERVRAFVRHPLAGWALFGFVFLFLWHSAHRIYHSLHDLGIHAGWAAKLACYGTAAVGSGWAAWMLLQLAA